MKIRKIVKAGRSYYISIPKDFITDEMMTNGVTIEIIYYDKQSITLKLRVADGKHDKGD